MQIDESAREQPLEAISKAVGEEEDVILSGPNAPSIVNKAHMNVHYHHHHYYKHSRPDDFIPTTIPLKREREDEDRYEHYPEALSASMSVDQSKTDDTALEHPSKRVRIQEPETEKTNTKKIKTEEVQDEEFPDQLSVEPRHGPEHVKVKTCRVCSAQFVRSENKPQADGNLPCRYHEGALSHPSGSKTKKKGDRVWSCCHAAPDDAGCVFAKHKAKGNKRVKPDAE